MYSLLRSVAGLSSPSSNFYNCSSPRESALVFIDYLRSHFSVSQPKALRSRARGYLSELRQARCPEESHSSFCFPFFPAEFLAAATNSSSSIATGPDKVAYPMLQHFLALTWIFCYIFSIFPGLCIPFLPSGNIHYYSIYSHSQDGNTSRLSCFLPAYLSPLLLSELFECIILSLLLFFLESNSILSPRQAGFCLNGLLSYQILFLSLFILDGSNKPKAGFRTILDTIDFFETFDSVWQPTLSHKLISAGFPRCFARWT